MGDSEKKTQKTPETKPARKKGFFQGLKAEFKRIIWPDREKLVKETTAVVVITIVLSIIIAAIDAGMKIGLDKIFQIG